MQVQKLVIEALHRAELANNTAVTASELAYSINMRLYHRGAQDQITQKQISTVMNRFARIGGYPSAVDPNKRVTVTCGRFVGVWVVQL